MINLDEIIEQTQKEVQQHAKTKAKTKVLTKKTNTSSNKPKDSSYEYLTLKELIKHSGKESVMWKKVSESLQDGSFNPKFRKLKLSNDNPLKSFIPEISEDYVVTPETAFPILMAWELEENVLLAGPTGCGKSSIIEQLCALTNRPFIRINSSGDMDSSHLFGSMVVRDNETIWEDGPVTECAKYGGVLLWDEWDVSPPEITMSMQWLLEKNGKLVLKEKPGTSEDRTVNPHKDFRIVCSGNTLGTGDHTGNFVGTEVQNSASIDRFETIVYLDYMSPAQEKKLIKNKFKELDKDFINNLVKLGNLVRKSFQSGALSHTISVRALLNIAHKTVYFNGDYELALKYSYENKLSPTEVTTFNELKTKVFGDTSEEDLSTESSEAVSEEAPF